MIEQAKGIIMASRRCSADEAFDILRQQSQYENVKLHALATLLVEAQSVGRGNGAADGGRHAHRRPERSTR